MLARKPKEGAFYSVALAMIILGASILAAGVSFWILNMFYNYSMSMPSEKVIGGTIICALGYIILELELVRKN